MELIDKNALVEKINTLMFDEFKYNSYDEATGFQSALTEIEEFIDTLEVKEVDLEKVIDNYLNPIEAWQIQEEPFSSMEKIAKHFFELGLKAQKGK